ncbi:winged helix-turn-helix domain-containing protein [Sphingomonas sp. BT-65]|uniref:winged helix-turn-helix domain-containing protein n=1 Tax=Sphingomonas sp. BT-65 TaxID=2989821 RepID=UPI002236180E|nr:winged helix-turn-helix domain-containing protein [Sphingomonas sp. BT-65]MCW4463111.1 winged helix-turn-helix domain-containing protein [Sphingomonas sp. BT-65]
MRKGAGTERLERFDHHRGVFILAKVRSRIARDIQPVRSRYLYMIALLDFIRRRGPTSPQDAYRWMIEQGIARKDDQVIIQKDGGSRFHKEVRFARQELFGASLIKRERNGKWGLTPAGETTFLTVDGARALVARRHGAAGADVEGEVLSSEGFAPTRGPVPVDWVGTIVRSTKSLCWTYAMQFGQTSIWKIGLACDVDGRARQLNQHIPHEVIQDKWMSAIRHPWNNAAEAYKMEQLILTELSDVRTAGERVRCCRERVDRAWHDSLHKMALE